MFKYDTVHGVYKGTVSHDDKHLIVDGHKIRVHNELDASKIKWYAPLVSSTPKARASDSPLFPLPL
jgi:glyceraldehyde-3-phosphate dehydrogenase/erythrose-4-phosphate dehydrogenase